MPPSSNGAVSIPDRKLLLLDGDRIVKTYDVAASRVLTPIMRRRFP
jgi:hypothetical protein